VKWTSEGVIPAPFGENTLWVEVLSNDEMYDLSGKIIYSVFQHNCIIYHWECWWSQEIFTPILYLLMYWMKFSSLSMPHSFEDPLVQQKNASIRKWKAFMVLLNYMDLLDFLHSYTNRWTLDLYMLNIKHYLHSLLSCYYSLAKKTISTMQDIDHDIS
jgi:hypothetical protein